jgi:hypothetical protein
MGPYIKDGHYMYGENQYCNPRPPYYNCIHHHKQPCIRDFPNKVPFTDGTPFKPDDSDATDEINRTALQFNLVNIETRLITSLDITLYGTSKDLDKHFVMEIGKRYAITYMTEAGYKITTGILREISNNVPATCLRYIGDFTAPATSAYIGMDCSTAGQSDRRLIYIATIRDITELAEDDTPPTLDVTTDSQKIDAIYEAIKNGDFGSSTECADDCSCRPVVGEEEEVKSDVPEDGDIIWM